MAFGNLGTGLPRELPTPGRGVGIASVVCVGGSGGRGCPDRGQDRHWYSVLQVLRQRSWYVWVASSRKHPVLFDVIRPHFTHRPLKLHRGARTARS